MDLLTIKHEKGVCFSVDLSFPQDPGPRRAALWRAAQNCLVHNTQGKGLEIDMEMAKDRRP